MVRSRAVVVAILAAASVAGWFLGTARGAADTNYTVTRAVDGDTIHVTGPGGSHDIVRLLGINTPETHDPRKPVECFGPEAAAYTKSRLEGRTVRHHTNRFRHSVMNTLSRHVSAPRGTTLSCKGWPQEAALRMRSYRHQPA